MEEPKTKISKTTLTLNKPFFTIWAPFPEDVVREIEVIVAPLKQLSVSITTLNAKHYYPHITLRYLGFASAELEEAVNNDKEYFSKIIKAHMPIKISMQGFSLFEDGQGQLRASWDIVGKDELTKLHDALYNNSRYKGFDELEGKKYNPHIIIAKANMEIEDIHKKYLKVLKNLSNIKLTFTLEKAEINISGVKNAKGEEDSYQVPLN